ncbi:AlpA family phage regulatory protein [Aquabacterium soli]|uniref:AlpA family phage regulatory protein n=1 Tax=Aquabacterium soli TaxID=2493092 RepID=A0A3R8RZK7_9BURK|nr:AlpA family phage regulatory protein [Aquabacterium soli]RRS00053.1 AlpA family phage regulatory protein [Aquabacterium soli]
MASVVAQQIQAAQHHRGTLLKVDTVSAITGLSRNAIYARMAVGGFPAQIRLSPRCVRWSAGSVLDWLDAQAA